MNVSFYAPMRPPGASGASGDRTIAGELWSGLEELGHHVTLASPLKSWSAAPQNLDQLGVRGSDEAARLHGRQVDLFFTYHCYYKAPDLIGPRLAARGIPYIIAEASHSPKREHGPWAAGFAASAHAIAAANALLTLSARDRPALEAAGYQAKLIDLPLYSRLPRAELGTGKPGDLITVAMMRAGDKLASYQFLANALSKVAGDWHLSIVGDGPARGEVETAFAPLKTRVDFKGAKHGDALAALLSAAGTYVWPGTREGLGMSYIEAQAAGLPCVALDEPGPRAAIGAGGRLTTPENFAPALSGLLGDDAEWAALKVAAIARAATMHTRSNFLRALQSALTMARP